METNVVFKEMARRSERINPLVAIKLLHTLVWAIMAGSIWHFQRRFCSKGSTPR
jgi:hypothetical protein